MPCVSPHPVYVYCIYTTSVSFVLEGFSSVRPASLTSEGAAILRAEIKREIMSEEVQSLRLQTKTTGREPGI